MPLVECVPNFSEGRRVEVIAALVEAARSTPAVFLDVSSDPDHNRTVITFVGEPHDVAEAMFRATQVAVERINVAEHSGVHPRMGAVDVIPFIPLRDISLEACADLARSFGARLGTELGIPVYLYEAAALRPERVNLADVRRGGYELLQTEITTPARAPDFGPARLGSAGAVAVGARAPLIAFNAFLDTADVAVAQAVALAIRELGGGLPYLKALGLLVGGQAQVSMNVVDFRQMPLFTIMETLRAEVRKYGVSITRTELVGLIPQKALFDYALASLQLPAQTHDQILEYRLGAALGDYREVIFE